MQRPSHRTTSAVNQRNAHLTAALLGASLTVLLAALWPAAVRAQPQDNDSSPVGNYFRNNLRNLGLSFGAPYSPEVRAELARSLALSNEQLNARGLTALSGGRAMALSKLNPKALPRDLVVAQRIAQQAQVVSQSSGDYWGGGLSYSGASSNRSQRDTGGSQPVATYTLPIQFRTRTAGGSPVSFQAVLIVLTGLQYKAGSRLFVSNIAVGLRNPEKPADRSTLSNGIKLLISAEDAESVTPGEVEMNKLGEPQTVQISASAPTAPFKVAARTLLDAGDHVEIPVQKKPFVLSPARSVIDGWGLAKTTVQIEVPGLQDQGAPYTISLSTDRGQISPTPLQLDAEGRATAELRSAGTGTATIKAAGGPFSATTTTVRYSFPLDFIVTTLLGGIAGWLARKRARHLTLRSCVVALVSACILGVAYAIGIHWLKWAPDTDVGEGLTFFVAAIGAYSKLKILTAQKEGDEKARGSDTTRLEITRRAPSPADDTQVRDWTAPGRRTDSHSDSRSDSRTGRLAGRPTGRPAETTLLTAVRTVKRLAATAELAARARIDASREHAPAVQASDGQRPPLPPLGRKM